MNYHHTTITVDNRCLDLLLTEEEIASFFARSLQSANQKYISDSKCCSCWSTKKPPQCNFWTKILGLCLECDCPKT